MVRNIRQILLFKLMSEYIKGCERYDPFIIGYAGKHSKRKTQSRLQLSLNSSSLKSVFEKLRFRDGLVWTVGLTVEIKLKIYFIHDLYIGNVFSRSILIRFFHSVMWADSFVIDNEPSELSQVNYTASYQLFGSIGEHAQQLHNFATDQYTQQPSTGDLLAPQPQFPYEAWSDSKSSFEAASDSTVTWDQEPSVEQEFSTSQPQYMDSNSEVRQ